MVVPESTGVEEPLVKTALVVNPNMVGVLRVFREMEKQKDRLAKVYLSDRPSEFPDSVDTVIFGAWDEQYLTNTIKTSEKWYNAIVEDGVVKSKPFRAYVLWTSPIAQSEMEPYELQALMDIKRYTEAGVFDGIWFGSPDWLNLFPKDDKKYFWAPYPISLKRPPPNVVIHTSEVRMKQVSMFGPTHMRKNFYTQVAAVKAAGAVLHTNRMDEMQTRFCQQMGVNFVPHQWMPEKEYFETIQCMDIGLQVSHCGVESNSYVFFDHLMMGIPCLTSMDDAPAQLRCLPNDIHRMVMKIQDGFEYEDWREWVRGYAENRNKLFNQTFAERGL